MAIQDQIARLTQAKEDFKTKLIEKGVEVTDDELISDYPPKLDLIQTGVDTTDANAVAGDIRFGKTAYVNEAKVTGLLEDYDGSFEGEGFEEFRIPELTNVKISPDGIVSWDALDVAGIENYTPNSLKYYVTVNEVYTFSTTSTSSSVYNYLRIGTNTVSVYAKVTLTIDGNKYYDTTEKIIVNMDLELLETRLPYFMQYNKIEVINNNAYLIGGSYQNKAAFKGIIRFNFEDGSTEEFNTGSNIGSQNIFTCAVGNDIYIATNESRFIHIHKFDTVSGTLTRLTGFSNSQWFNSRGIGVYVENENCIYFYGYYYEKIYVYVYDITNNTITFSKSCSTIKYEYGMQIINLNNDIYILWGEDSWGNKSGKVTKYDLESNTTTQVYDFYTGANGINYKKTCYSAAVAYNNDIYMFGGGDPDKTSSGVSILRFDSEELSGELLTKQLPVVTFDACATVYNNNIYLFGGGSLNYRYTGGVLYDTIFKFTVEEES